MMRVLSLGAVTVVIVSIALGVLWATEILVGDELRRVAAYSYGALAIIITGGLALRAISGNRPGRDETDRPVP